MAFRGTMRRRNVAIASCGIGRRLSAAQVRRLTDTSGQERILIVAANVREWSVRDP